MSHETINSQTAQPGIVFEPPIMNNNIHSTRSNLPSSESIFKPVPKSDKCPVGNYYAEINWDDDFGKWPLVRFSTPMDGSCLFHAISNSFYQPYRTEILHEKPMTRSKIVAALRSELGEKLGNTISDEQDAPRYYDILNGGNTSAFAEAVPEFSLNYMQDQLMSTSPIGYGYMEFIGNALNKDIYILEAIRRNIYKTNELPFTIKGNRNSIVLYYMNGHYELVGIRNSDDTFSTHFTPEHSFIRFLYSTVKQLTQ